MVLSPVKGEPRILDTELGERQGQAKDYIVAIARHHGPRR
jgi:hypothetical protein